MKPWNELGRYVRRGEKGIAILAPCLPPRILKCPVCGRTFAERELRAHILEAHPAQDVSGLVRRAKEEVTTLPAKAGSFSGTNPEGSVRASIYYERS